MHGHIGAAAHGDTDIGRGQRWRIIDAVADHCDHAGFLQRSDSGGFVRRQDLCVHILDAQRLGDHVGTASVVTGQQMTADIARAQLLYRLQRARLERIAESEQAQHSRLGTLLDQPGQGPAFGFPRACGTCQSAGVQAAFLQQAPITQRQAPIPERAGNASAGQG
ncbi:hypothetical protein D3C73_471790 [compost metagenome]